MKIRELLKELAKYDMDGDVVFWKIISPEEYQAVDFYVAKAKTNGKRDFSHIHFYEKL